MTGGELRAGTERELKQFGLVRQWTLGRTSAVALGGVGIDGMWEGGELS